MRTLGRTTRNGKKAAPRRVDSGERSHQAEAKLAVALKEYKEAVEQQQATVDVLRALSRSSTDPQPVFDAIVKHAHHLCGAVFSILYRYDGTMMSVVADRHAKPAASRALRQLYPAPPRRDHIVGRSILEGRAFFSADISSDARFPANRNAFFKTAPFCAGLAVPLLRQGTVVGAIATGRPDATPYTKKEIGLLQTFAEQAVIAIENVRLFNETKEALEHQKASAEVLRIVAGSVEDTDPVFEAITSAAMRLMPDIRVALFLARDGRLHYASHSGIAERRRAELAKIFPIQLDRDTANGIAVIDKRIVHIADIHAAPKDMERALELSRRSGYRAILCVPLIREGAALGTLSMTRIEAGPFSEKQITLAKTFADQAVIAIQNAKMFQEIQDRNAELKESLEFQGATGAILTSISSSITEAKPVFDAIIENLLRLFGTAFASVQLVRDGQIDLVAVKGEGGFEKVSQRYPLPLDDRTLSGRAMLAGEVMQLAPISGNPAAPPETVRHAKVFGGGFECLISAPMVREGKVIGAVTTARRSAIPFDDKQVALIKSFADQAVIAIENARLFNETKEALERQTATSEVLRVISHSQTDAQPVFEAIIRSAVRLCAGTYGHMTRVDGDTLHLWAHHGNSPEALEMLSGRYPAPLSEKSLIALAVRTRALVHSPDTLNDPRASHRTYTKALNLRAQVSVPLIRGDVVIGTLNVQRDTPGAFAEEQLELLRTFADQAVIAIENARLFNETKEALERQTATGEILRVIAGTPADAQPVFDAIAQSALRLFGVSHVGVTLREGDSIRSKATAGTVDPRGDFEIPLNRDSTAGRAILDRTVINVEDTEAPDAPSFARDSGRVVGFRAIVAAPMLREGIAIGSVHVMRKSPGPFSAAQIELLKTFADQAVIAIENARLFNETKESLEQQTATAEILKVISSSPTATQPVFDAIVQSAARLFSPCNVALVMREGHLVQRKATAGPQVSPLEQDRLAKIYPLPFDPDRSLAARVMFERRIIEVPDTEAAGLPEMVAPVARAAGYRSLTAVPLVREGEGIGAIGINHPEPGFRLSEKQLGLLRTFADQAVIAIENVRLFNETKEALERQTATSEILRVIAGTPTDTQPVFDAIVQSAQRLMSGKSAILLLRRETDFFVAAYSIPGLERLPAEVRTAPLDRDKNFPSQVMLDRKIVHVPDWEADDVIEFEKFVAKAYGIGSGLQVPLVRKGEGIGSLAVTREAKGPFSEKEIALLQSFADQAVIAIENVRLFNETKESLEQQTATSQVLDVISRSRSDLKPVFDAILDSAIRLCDAHMGIVGTYDGKTYRTGTHRVPNPEFAKWLDDRGPFVPHPSSGVGRMIAERRAIQVLDLRDSPMYRERTPVAVGMVEKAGARSYLVVPMLKDEQIIGGIAIYRPEVRAFTEPQVELLSTFAAQAAIAVENVRLFNEINEALRLQTSTAEVLKTISRSTFDLDKVLQALLDNAARLSGAERGAMLRPDALGNYVPTVIFNYLPDSPLIARMRAHPIRPGRDSINGRVLLEKRPIHVPDVLADPEYGRQDLLGAGRFRTVLSVPMLRDGEAIGLITLNKGEKLDPFTDKQLELVTTFADQAVIAIENVRLFKEIEEKSAQLEVANKHKSDFLANMSHELRTPLNAIIGFSEALTDRMFGELSDKQADYLKDIHESGKHLLSLINDILDLSKIEAGRMELDLSSFHLPTAISNAMTLMRERAQRHGVALEQDVDSRLGEFTADERKVKQVLLNLLSNAVKFTPAGGRVEVSARLDTDHVEIAVRDTGVGISAEDQGSLFEEFRQVGKDSSRKAEGTGLGLALTKRFVELHGGAIRVESAQGKGSTFTFSLPVR